MSADRLYGLLPAIHRIRDAERGEPLRALLGVIEELHDGLERDVAGLYDDWFIETCAEWVVPYLGDLVGARALDPATPDREGDVPFSLRAYVANTLAYRRRKGTASMLEQLARDVTGWPARAVEYFQLLAGTQHLNHLRLDRPAVAGLGDADALERIGTPFDAFARTVNVRAVGDVGRVPAPDGRHNIPNIGLHLWRLQAYPVARGGARAIAPGIYTFDPLGADRPLVALPRTETAISVLATELNVPVPLRRRPLHAELEALRTAAARGAAPPAAAWFDPGAPVLEVFLARAGEAVPAAEILLCDLSGAQRPPAARAYPDGAGGTIDLPVAVAVDPVLGRLALPEASAPEAVEVGFSYAFAADLGGGPYDRRSAVARRLRGAVDWQAGVSTHVAPGDGVFATISDAVTAWHGLPAAPEGRTGVIAIMDSSTYVEDVAIDVPAGCQLLVVAADWLPVLDPDTGTPARRPGDLVPDELRPHLRGDVVVRGTASATSVNPGELVLNGLLVEGRVTVRPGNLGGLAVDHCTLVPGQGGVRVESAAPGSPDTNPQLEITVDRSICDRVVAAATVPAVAVFDSLVGSGTLAPAADAIDAPGARVAIESSTIFNAVEARSLDGSNSLFAGRVRVAERQRGCMRYSFVADRPSTRAPRRFRCQPDLALGARATALGLTGPAALPAAERARVVARVQPAWVSIRHGDAGFGQLRRSVPVELRTGAEDGQEMGAFRHLQHARREGNLATSLEEYLRLGLAAGVFFET